MSKVLIGKVFSLFNRRLRCSYAGTLHEVCKKIELSGRVVGDLWGDVDSQVRAYPVACSILAIVGEQRSAVLESLWSDLRSAITQGRNLEFDVLKQATAGLRPDGRRVVARLAFTCGALSAMDKLGLDADLDVQATDRFGMTAIGWSCSLGHARCLKWAMDAGAPLEHANAFSWNYADLAVANKHAGIAGDLARINVAPPGRTMVAEMQRCGIPLSAG